MSLGLVMEDDSTIGMVKREASRAGHIGKDPLEVSRAANH